MAEVKVYSFREDLFDFVKELRTKIMLSDSKFLERFKKATLALQEIFKEDKKKIYTLSKQSKLLLDKALFKKNYDGKNLVTLDSYPFDLWELSLVPETFDRFIMVDKKKNLIKQIGGVPATPVRDTVKFRLIHHNRPLLLATKETEIGNGMSVIKMTEKDLEVMKPFLEKARDEIIGD